MSQQFLTVVEIAEELGRSVRAVRALIEDGRIEAVKVGNHVRIRRTEFDRFLAALPPVRKRNRRANATPAIAGAQSPFAAALSELQRLIADPDAVMRMIGATSPANPR